MLILLIFLHPLSNAQSKSTVKSDLRFIFDLISQNMLPHPIKRYFTDVYLFCLHRLH